ncbi:uncharacterized protein PHACADRAFT_155296 [Phanerochaete carnosa HHB-10118-sp]|uniref:Uncharacterized protein n=1 Tax=Phanerochaete carnosa (strain HHB-10118-sp) TaxID=650164 RepID=K5UFA3_PHACS|nr:uncharacterized protein PHACADRAFT_155296 [Phanerochaete carnosa HHB-10118-sp]EKM48131.1 hypothetical protein PHACADRAFT_155296 [Phanerochaete carnosa HHB-10118-sp]
MAFTGSSPLATTYSDSISPEVAVTIEAFAEAIRPAINYALLFTIFASMLIPILITLLWFSTPTTRRQPIFILNVASILVGIGIAMFDSHTLKLFGVSNPTIQMSGSTSTAFIVILLLSPWVAELVLVFRLAIVFPPRRTPLSKLAAVSAFPVVVKCARLGCLASFWKVFVRETTQYSGALTETENIGWQQFPYIRATCLLQLFDDA